LKCAFFASRLKCAFLLLVSHLLGREFRDVGLLTQKPVALTFCDDYVPKAREPMQQPSFNETPD
jgi:hypothetical protein